MPVTPAPPTPAVTDEGRFTPEELIAPPTAPPRPPEQRPANDGNARVQASPVARRLAEELGLDLSLIPGTGPEGRVVRADIEAAQAQGLARPPMPAGAVPAAQSEFTPPSPSGPQPPIPPVDPAPVEPDVPEQPAPEVPAQPAPEPDVPAQPAPDPDVPAEPEPQPAPVEPEVPGQPAPEPDVPAEPEPPAPEPELPADPAPEPAPELPIEPTPEPELPADPTPTPEVPVPTTDAPGPTADAEQVTLPAAQPGRGKGEPRVVELSRQGQTIARRMAESKGTIPHFTVRSEVDAEPILQLRADLASNRPDMAPPSINDLVIRATALALRAHPRLNGAYRDGRVEEYPRINIGIPVDVEDGLPVPVVQDVDRLSLGEIAERSSELIGKAREGTLRPADVASATFTVSNLGVYGVDEFTAVITPGQAAILTVGAVAGRPVARDGELTVGQTFTLTLLVDHRAVYGAPAARFLARVRKLLEHPTSLLA
ncbi:MAG: 2-oxo acid dehydrogenase subunit E2 [Patulibacter minatonensis]